MPRKVRAPPDAACSRYGPGVGVWPDPGPGPGPVPGPCSTGGGGGGGGGACFSASAVPTGLASLQPSKTSHLLAVSGGVVASIGPSSAPAVSRPTKTSTPHRWPSFHSIVDPKAALAWMLPPFALPTPTSRLASSVALAVPEISSSPSTHVFVPSARKSALLYEPRSSVNTPVLATLNVKAESEPSTLAVAVNGIVA